MSKDKSLGKCSQGFACAKWTYLLHLTYYVLMCLSQTKGINVNGGDIPWIITKAWEIVYNTNYIEIIKTHTFPFSFFVYCFLVYFYFSCDFQLHFKHLTKGLGLAWNLNQFLYKFLLLPYFSFLTHLASSNSPWLCRSSGELLPNHVM